MFCFGFEGSGIGTGPGVIQDRFSPTMGRHRSNQIFNGHGGHVTPQSQFGEMGSKSFLKSNQVRDDTIASPLEQLDKSCFFTANKTTLDYFSNYLMSTVWPIE